ncbi:hypothetical protein GCM10010121_029280 [Streptomyces brasiliensis]|uniref:Uncharacterized protein n=1 Tax=Streptomyces brasiliensis TaxID=1954 RepID=A0A917KLA5_9ACTN|nr:hypothetical protein GCM10010121_029280 [Streptomyces brasiliensis]
MKGECGGTREGRHAKGRFTYVREPAFSEYRGFAEEAARQDNTPAGRPPVPRQ